MNLTYFIRLGVYFYMISHARQITVLHSGVIPNHVNGVIHTHNITYIAPRFIVRT